MPKHERSPKEHKRVMRDRLDISTHGDATPVTIPSAMPLYYHNGASASGKTYEPGLHIFGDQAIIPGGANTGETTRLPRICRECGDTLPDGAAFCIGCGVEAQDA